MNTFYITLLHFIIQMCLWHQITNSLLASFVYAGLAAGMAYLMGRGIAYQLADKYKN